MNELPDSNQPSSPMDQSVQLAEMNKANMDRQQREPDITSMATQIAGAVNNPLGVSKPGQIIGMAEGGLASAAQNIQDKGRKGDSMLVHMTPNEVRGLQAIAMQHGGSLTINPRTGLVEAGFLSNILPMVAGAALTIGSGGAINPYMSAAIVGGFTGLASGSLQKGLMAGLGAFGGAGLGTALGAAGGAGAASTVGQTITPQLASTTAITPQAVASTAPQAIAGPSVSSIYPQEFMRGSAAQFFDPSVAAGAVPTSAAPAGIVRAYTPSIMENFAQAGRGVSNIFDFSSPAGTEARKAFIGQAADKKTEQEATGLGGTTGVLKTAGALAAPMMFSAQEPDEEGKKPQEYIRPYSFDFNRADADPEFKYRTGAPGESTAEQRYFTPEFKGLGVFKAGTEPGPSFYGTPTEEQLALYSKPRPGSEGNVSRSKNRGLLGLGFLGLSGGGLTGLGKGGLRDGAFIVPADVVAHLGNGSNDAGQKILARGLGSRPIKGKGDGMSDSIPTSIEGKQPARVADGEAYIPPEVVKKVGSKRLYAMMDKIRQARTGTKKQAPEVNPRQFMPA